MKKTLTISLHGLFFLFLIIPYLTNAQFTSSGFITTWKTDNPGSSSNTQITIPTIGENPNFDSYNFDIYWEEVDNSINNGTLLGNTGNTTITFPSAGQYRVQITGVFPSILFNYTGDAEKILAVEQWGDIEWQYLSYAFAGCSNLTIPATDAPDLTGVTDAARMFANASSFNEPVNHWNTSSITTMNFMFAGASSFNQDLSNWDVSNVTSTNGLTYMFSGASAFNQDISSWNVSNVKDMSYMFRDASSFNQDISAWVVTSVTTMAGMFNNATSFNQNINSWNITSVSNMGSMFWGASSFNQPLNNWNMSNVTSMVSMFREASAFDQDISNWDVGMVGGFARVFQDASSFNQDIGSWDISDATSMINMLDNTGLSSTNYNSILTSWAGQSVKPNVTLGVNGLTYSCDGLVARTSLSASPNGWTIIGDTNDCDSFDTTWKTDNPGSTSSTSILIPTTGTGYDYSVVWEEVGNSTNFGTAGSFNDGNAPHTIDFGISGTYKVSIVGDFPHIYFNNAGDKEKLITIERWGPNQWTSMEGAFHGCANLTIASTDIPDLSGVTNLNSMFQGASSFNQEISSWDVSTVTTMQDLFNEAILFNQDIGEWDVSEVTSMQGMFKNATAFNQDIGDWNVGKVLDMGAMFFNATNFNQDISGWDVGSVTDMAGVDDVNSGMFRNATSFNQDISMWDVSEVLQLSYMLSGATSFNQNLGNWDISNAVEVYEMLANSGLSKQNYDETLIGWASQTVQSGLSLAATGLIYCGGAQARQDLITAGWTISGDTEECLPFISTWKSDNIGDTDDNQVNVAINSPSDVNVYWEEVGNASNNGVLEDQTAGFTLTFPQAGTYQIEISGSIHGLSFGGGDKEKLLTIEQWGDNKWTSMIGAFSGCNNLSINAADAPNFTLVTHTVNMFKDNINFNSDIDHWDMSNVTDMTEMFMGATSFNQDLNSWDVSGVTTTLRMFANASAFDGAIDQWDMSSAGSVFQMFEGATSFNQPIGVWDASSFTDAYNMFSSATSFNQNLGAWELATIQNLAGFFENSGISEENYDNSLIGWSNNANTASNVNLRSNGLTYCTAVEARNKLINDLNWSILGDRNSCLEPFITTWKTDNEGTSEDNQITIPVNDNLEYLYEVYWEDVNNAAVNGMLTGQTGSATITFPQAGTYKLEIKDVFPAIQFFNDGDLQKILSIEQWGGIEWESMEHAFWGASNLVLNATDAPDLSGVTSLRNMFRDADSFNGDLNNWDLSSVSDIQYMFTSSDSFTGLIDEWDVSSVENFQYMFAEASAFDSNLADWDISSATNVIGMFDNSGLSYQNYDNILVGWSELPTTPENLSLGANGVNFCEAEAARNVLITNFSWSIGDGGKPGPTADENSLPDLTGECEMQMPTAPTATDCNGNSFDGVPDVTFPITIQGTTIVTWTYDDGNGNTSTQTQNIILDDTEAPVPDAATLSDLSANCSLTPTAPTATDGCQGEITGTSNTVFPITLQGTTVITWTFDDGNGNTSSQTQNVILQDTELPIPDVIALSDLSESCSITPTAPTATDSCDGDIVATSDTEFPITAQGTTIVTWSYEDGSGNSATQTQNVIIEDITDPVPDEETLSDVTSTCEFISIAAPTATDNCTGQVDGVSDVTFPMTTIGTTTITWTFSDGNGNTTTQQQNVIISDEVEPVVDSETLPTITADCDGLVTQPQVPTATDNCVGQISASTDQTFPFTATANTQIIWEYDDGNGNTSTQLQDVIVITSDPVTVEESLCEGAEFTFPDGTVWTGETSQVSMLTNQQGCDSLVTTNVTVLALPVVDLGADEVFGCVGQELTFSIDESSIEFETYTISTLFGNSATDGPLTFEFSNAFAAATTTSQVFVTIELTSADGCVGTDQVQLFDNTMVNWSIGSTQVNDPEVVITSAVLPEKADAFVWDFGDGTTNSIDVNPTHTYTENGDYEIKLTVSNECGDESRSTFVSITGIEDPLGIQDDRILIYPNPITTRFRVETSKVMEVQLFSLDGKKVHSANTSNGFVDISNLDTGQYIIHLIHDGKIELIEKVIKIN